MKQAGLNEQNYAKSNLQNVVTTWKRKQKAKLNIGSPEIN